MNKNRIRRAEALLSMSTELAAGDHIAYFVALPYEHGAGHGTITAGVATIIELPFEIVDATRAVEQRRPSMLLAMMGDLHSRVDVQIFVRDVIANAPGSLVAVPCPEGWDPIDMQQSIQGVPGALCSYMLI